MFGRVHGDAGDRRLAVDAIARLAENAANAPRGEPRQREVGDGLCHGEAPQGEENGCQEG